MEKILIICSILFTQISFSQVTVKIHEHLGYSNKQLIKLDSVKKLIETVINSDEFREEVLKMKVSVDNNPDRLSNIEIFDRIIQANEIAYNNDLKVIDLNLRIKPKPFYKPFTCVVGYTKPSINYIVTYRGKFNRYSICELAGHYIHEWIHKLGFNHYDKQTKGDSVPYLIGNVVEKTAQKISTCKK